MKKTIFLSLLVLVAVFLTGCASKRKVLSTQTSEHLTVEQTSEGVYIVAHKDKSEDISKIQIIDSETGSGAVIDLTSNDSVEFLWPYAETGKSYTIDAVISGNKTSVKESVTFKTEAVSASIVNYNKEYNQTKIVLIATENKRNVKLYTSKETLLSVVGTAVANAEITVDIFSGKRLGNSKKDSSTSVYIGSFSKKILNVADLTSLLNGYDIISTASTFGLSPAELNKKLSSKPTYYARVYVSFNLSEDDSSAVKYTTKYLYSNDTIYTPVRDVTAVTASMDAK